MVKRKADTPVDDGKPVKKRGKDALTDEEAKARFRKGLFDKDVLDRYISLHATSTPYKHCVISGLVDDTLLRSVRSEIQANVSFTPKETDIYKIHQSGDLANLDGLDDASLAKLPSLLRLRDAIYSPAFRAYVASITGCGPLSGRKTDMAINVYTPGCYLLCHDDVIGSRKISYILYLVDPDVPWRPEWGGALRLFPVTERPGENGAETALTVEPDVVKSVPPAWNQLSFFEVQPGRSFHDVEEVYHAESAEELAKNAGRVRMAISGWFHIPQIGEEGYVPGAEEEQAKNSGLMQLQGNPDQHDTPQPAPVVVERGKDKDAEDELDEKDLEFLLKYISPTYLTPDTLEPVAEQFEQNCSITLPDILTPKFADRLKAYVEAQEATKLPEASAEIEKSASGWKVARPPHKQRFLYLQPGAAKAEAEKDSPLKELIETLLPSRPFRVWLQMATRSIIESHDVLARRFRRGLDYTLATGHEGKPRIEMNIGITPTPGWGDNEDGDEYEEEVPDEEEQQAEDGAAEPSKPQNGTSKTNGKSKSNGDVATASPKGKGKAKSEEKATTGPDKDLPEEEDNDVGGLEVYMAGDDDADEDAAVYKTASAAADDDNILFYQAASWNKMTLVLRDSGTLRFVKYVSRNAKGDRWDVSAMFDIEEQEEGDEDLGEEEEVETGRGTAEVVRGVIDDTSEEEFRGFSESEDSDSD